jgi:hypothetical protein
MKLTDTCWRAWSVGNMYQSAEGAKEAVELLALSGGILDFIRHGDGQTHPKSVLDVPSPSSAVSQYTRRDAPRTEKKTTVTLSDWLQTFPHTLPPGVGLSQGSQQPLAWIQSLCKPRKGGAVVSPRFIWTWGENVARM